MKKLILSLLAVVMCATSVVFAQDNAPKKETVIVDVFTAREGGKGPRRAIVTGIRDMVITSLHKTQRINIVDVTTEGFFQKAESDASSEAALTSMLDGADVRQSASKNFEAKYAIMGNVTNMNAVHKRTEEGKPFFNGELSVTIKVISLEDGTIVHTKDYTYSGLTGQIGDTEEAAIINTANLLEAAIPRFVDTAFPVTGEIIEILSEKKGEAKEVYINLGSAAGIKEKDKFEVFQVKTVAGNEMKTEIGELTVSEVGGEAISVCKVSKCGKQISQFIKDPSSIKLVIVSRPKSNVGGTLTGIGKGLIN